MIEQETQRCECCGTPIDKSEAWYEVKHHDVIIHEKDGSEHPLSLCFCSKECQEKVYGKDYEFGKVTVVKD